MFHPMTRSFQSSQCTKAFKEKAQEESEGEPAGSVMFSLHWRCEVVLPGTLSQRSDVFMHGFIPLGITIQFVQLLKLAFLAVQITRIYGQCLRKHLKISEMHISSVAITIWFQSLSSHRSKQLKEDDDFAAFTSSEEFLATNECLSNPEVLVGAAIPNKVEKYPQL